MKSPRPTNLSGTVRGIAGTPNGETRVALITNSLESLTRSVYEPITRELIHFDLAAAAR